MVTLWDCNMHNNNHHCPVGIIAKPDNKRLLLISLLIVGGLMVTYVIGGVLSGSLALLSEAAHLLTDLFVLLFSWFSYHLITRPANLKYSFGYHRLHIIAAFFNSALLFAVTAVILLESVKRFLSNEQHIISWEYVLIISVIGLVINLLILFILHQTKEHNLNIKSIMLHVINDLLGILATLFSALIIKYTGWMLIDPITSIFIACIILHSTFRLIASTIHILLEGTPGNIESQTIKTAIEQNIDGVLDTHHIHIWALSENILLATLHLKISDNSKVQEILSKTRKLLKHYFGITHTTIELECAQEPCLNQCDK